MKGFLVIEPGILSSFQDLGRLGQHDIGLTVGGPMDALSFRNANQLCSNDKNASLIEIMVGGLIIESNLMTYIALTGASFPLKINGTFLSGSTTHKIYPGDRIEIGFAEDGMRGYLAVAGGFSVEPVFGSCSTVKREKIGGLYGDGQPITRGDFLPCPDNMACPPFFWESNHLSKHSEITTLRVILGYQVQTFDSMQKSTFFNSEYILSDRNDRMGARLTGPSVKSSLDGILSEGICLGAIQFPPDGMPIILLRDRQTIGGYPKIGSVFSLDLDKLSQLSPHSKVCFEQLSIEEAHNLLHLDLARSNRHKPRVNLKALSGEIEQLLVDKNPRGMRTLCDAIEPGSYLRAAQLINNNLGKILIGTGFPVNNTFETDGPAGAIALYNGIKKLGGDPVIVCDNPLLGLLESSFNTCEIQPNQNSATKLLKKYQPSLIISIERPGKASDGHYYNMRGDNITPECADFDSIVLHADCPSICIGDGGNEVGMGNVSEALKKLNINPSITDCEELLVADVSNWGAHGLLAILSRLTDQDLLAEWDNEKVLAYLSKGGSVDGVTGKNTLTEDGMDSSISQNIVNKLRKLSGFY